MPLLTPTSTEELILPAGRTIAVPKYFVRLERWNGPPVPDTYGGKVTLKLGEELLFAELVVLRLLEREGWQGVWVDSYRRKYRVSMPGTGEPVTLPEPQEAVMRNIRSNIGRTGGCWDVFAWRGSDCRFVELKRSRKDLIRENQLRWLEAALAMGLTANNFLLCEWDLT